MKILYGVQATGNGHITRARSMAGEFAEKNVEVDYLFSGRPCDQFFDMQVFGDYRCKRGLTFQTRKGRVRYAATLFNNNVFKMIHDVRELDLSAYDLIISDFEPISAWAARRQNRFSLGIAHQYAFQYDVPVAGRTLSGSAVLKHFAPTNVSIGLHWHDFGQPILPPLIEKNPYPLHKEKNCILVYLPFEDAAEVGTFLKDFSDYHFIVYCQINSPSRFLNIELKPFCRNGFQQDLACCEGVIANAGFGLSSEAIQAGKKLLVKPVQGQMEQLSNAKALQQLGLANVMQQADRSIFSQWLEKDSPDPVVYPNVARELVRWIVGGMQEETVELVESVWGKCANPAFETALLA